MRPLTRFAVWTYGDLRDRATCQGGDVSTSACSDWGRQQPTHLDACGSPLDEVCQLALPDALQALVHLFEREGQQL
jgi:hypothetical protein